MTFTLLIVGCVLLSFSVLSCLALAFSAAKPSPKYSEINLVRHLSFEEIQKEECKPTVRPFIQPFKSRS